MFTFGPRLLDSIHRLVGRSYLATRLCVKIRNQVNAIIGAYVGRSCKSNLNGEFLLLDRLAEGCQRFVDVGANVGTWTRYFLMKSPDSSGVLYEPGDETFKILKNSFGKFTNIDLRKKALSDHVGKAFFNEDCRGNRETSALYEHNVVETKPRLHLVDVSTLDSEFYESELKIDYLKIDAEGYDSRILFGGKRLFHDCRITYVQFEYNDMWLRAGSTLRATLEFFNDINYSVFLILPLGLKLFNYDVFGDFFRYSNFFALPNSRLDDVKGLLI